MDTRDRILELVKANGPVLPVKVSKEIGSNILMASAHLAELTASGRLKISSIKVGGSPLYYLPGQEEMLQKYSVNLNDKEKKAFELLKERRVLKDSEQEPVIRVALRELKDFAIPLNVSYNNSKEMFWKWHITSNEDAEQLIKSGLDVQKPEEKTIQAPQPQKTQEMAELKPPKKREKTKPKDKEDKFLNEVMRFFQKNGISAVSQNVVKKDSEIDFIIEVPSAVGSLQYYCKAKNKKRISDSDLSSAYVKGQLKRLPVIVISTGDLSAKAKEIIGRELSNLTFKKI